MFSNLKIGLRIVESIPAEGNESFNNFIRQHVNILRRRGTAKNGLDVDIFSRKCFHFGDLIFVAMADGIIDESSAGTHQRRIAFVVPAGRQERILRSTRA